MPRSLICLSLVVVAGCASEEDPVRRAASDLARAAQQKEAAEVCRLLFSSAFLPPEVAERAGVPPGSPGSTAGFAASQDECGQELDEELEAFAYEPALSDIRVLAVPATQGVDAVASATATYPGTGPQPVHFVRYMGHWRVLFISN